MVSIYISRSHGMNENLLSTLFQQLPKPVILIEEFNGYHQIWGSPANDYREFQVLSFKNKKLTENFKRRETHKNIGHHKVGNSHHILYSPSYPEMSQAAL